LEEYSASKDGSRQILDSARSEASTTTITASTARRPLETATTSSASSGSDTDPYALVSVIAVGSIAFSTDTPSLMSQTTRGSPVAVIGGIPTSDPRVVIGRRGDAPRTPVRRAVEDGQDGQEGTEEPIYYGDSAIPRQPGGVL
jgi:hypothetical protein